MVHQENNGTGEAKVRYKTIQWESVKTICFKKIIEKWRTEQAVNNKGQKREFRPS